MKTPISYYGGKQTMLKHILPLIDTQHVCYCEPFMGGGSVFFAKPVSDIECINDINGNVINFYRVLKNNFAELKKEIDCTLHSRALYKQSCEIYNNPENHNDIIRAWAFWNCCNMSFTGSTDGGWSFMVHKNGGSKPEAIFGKKKMFTEKFERRMKGVQIECDDAIKVIQRFDANTTLFYIDPPYLGANQGHYKGWTEDNEVELLELLSGIEGKFLLSSYPHEILTRYRESNNWNHKDVPGYVRVNNKGGEQYRKPKIECLTYNYEASDKQLEIF